MPRARKATTTPNLTVVENEQPVRKVIRLSAVTIKSDRPDMSGHPAKGLRGQGVILPDEPNMVYVTVQQTAGTVYGVWPLEETDAEEQIKAQQAPKVVQKPKGPMGQDTQVELLMKVLRDHPALQGSGSTLFSDANHTTYLVTSDNQYVRVPTWEEFESQKGK